jgi:hemolysin activation/secretion protein
MWICREFRSLPWVQMSKGAPEYQRCDFSKSGYLVIIAKFLLCDRLRRAVTPSQFNLGIGAFDATINENAPDSRFFSWQGQAQWVRLLAPETLLLLRLNTQLASTSLVPLEQLGVGGQESVRGYRQDFLLTDNGVFASAEVQVPILRAGGTLQVIPFADFGVGWNSGTQNPDSNMLAAVGLGLQWRGGDRFNARVDWGIPLVDVDSDGRTWQENGVYFSVIYNAF